MKILSFFIPSLLQRLDTYLMLQSPHVWRTRIHFVVFYTLIAWLIFFIAGFLYPLSMFDISRTPYAIDELKRVSSLFLLICGAFSLIYWWQEVAKFKILIAKWYHAFWECFLFFIGIVLIWQVVNAFKNGLDANIGYRMSWQISAADKAKLYEKNFYLPSCLDYNYDDQFSEYKPLDIKDSILAAQYFSTGEQILQKYHERLLKEGVVLDSQFVLHQDVKTRNAKSPYINNYFNYNQWKDTINSIAQRYIKPQWVLDDSKWYYNDKKERKKWILRPFESYNLWQLDSVYQLFNSYEKYQADSVRSVEVNTKIDLLRKEQRYFLTSVFENLMYRDIKGVLDTCPNVFFNNQQNPYLDILKGKCSEVEGKFRHKQIFEVFTKNDLKAYKAYLSNIMLLMPLNNRTQIKELEVGLYYRRDSLAYVFLNQISPKSKALYEECIAFEIDNNIDKNEAAELAGHLTWNKRTGKYQEIEKYITQGFLDTVYFYADSLINSHKKQDFIKIYDFINNGFLSRVYKEMEDWRESKDTFYLKYKCKYPYQYYYDQKECTITHKLRRDSIPIDTVYKWFITEHFDKSEFVRLEESGTYLNAYLKYRDTQISYEDSIMLDKIFTKTGYLRDSSEHSCLFFHANAYYLYLADIMINKSKAFLQGWNPLYLSANYKLAIIVLSFLMYFTTLASSNLFTAAFIAFFINFVNNTLFTMGNNFQMIDTHRQSFWLFSLLGVLAIFTAFHLFFKKHKTHFIYLLINVQLFALLGIFLWLFSAKEIENQNNYTYLAITFWGLIVWRFREYLALPVKK